LEKSPTRMPTIGNWRVPVRAGQLLASVIEITLNSPPARHATAKVRWKGKA
jgi:hypothetical protein